MTVRTGVEARNSQCIALNIRLGKGALFRVYTLPVRRHPESIAEGTLLVEVKLGNSVFGTVADGRMRTRPMPPTTILASGTAAWATFCRADGRSLIDLEIGPGKEIDMKKAPYLVQQGTLFDVAYEHIIPE